MASPHSEEVPDQQKTASHVSDDVSEVPDNYMDIPEQHRLVTIPARYFSQHDVPRYTRAERRDAASVYDYKYAPDEYEFNSAADKYPDEYKFNYEVNYAPNKYRYNRAPVSQANYADVPKHLIVTIPDRCFVFGLSAEDKDILGAAGGEEDGMRHHTMPRHSHVKKTFPRS